MATSSTVNYTSFEISARPARFIACSEHMQIFAQNVTIRDDLPAVATEIKLEAGFTILFKSNFGTFWQKLLENLTNISWINLINFDKIQKKRKKLFFRRDICLPVRVAKFQKFVLKLQSLIGSSAMFALCNNNYAHSGTNHTHACCWSVRLHVYILYIY